MNSICRRILLILSLASHCAVADGPTPRPNPERFAGEIAAFARQEPEKGGIVFIGSSSIRLWTALKEDFPGLPVVNRGFGGCVSNDLIVHFETLVARHEPKLIVSYVGGNDIAEKLTVQEAFDDYTKFLTLTHGRLPKTRIILNSIKFSPKRALQIPQVRELNRRLEIWAADKNWLRFIDSTKFLAGPQDQPDPSYFLEDQLHLNASGYAKWRAILDPVIREEWAKVQSTIAAEPVKPNFIVFYTDDHGYADLGVNRSVTDIKTPNLDALARSGAFASNGYSTAPQCVPSRAGLLVGRFQARFGVEANGGSLDGFNQSTTIAERLQAAGYVTAQFGKWHLGADTAIPEHGFKHFFAHAGQATLTSNITIDGKDRPLGRIPATKYHIDGCSQAAAAIIERYRDDPFFLYVAFRAPHTPLDAPKSYTARFPGEMPERRRQALAMIAAMDDGVGLIVETLKKHNLTHRTLIFVIGDNGAPLKIHKVDAPLNQDPGGWDGSLNTPLNGEKGMLSEGGMHVPFIVSWPGTIPAGQAYKHPVSSLDVAATAAALADTRTDPGELDGVNLIPHLKGEIKTPPHDALYWRWIAQSAIREGDWKLLRGGNREYLYNLATDIGEKNNLADKNPDITRRLRAKLTAWSAQLSPPGLTAGAMAPAWNQYFDHYLDGKTISSPPGGKGKNTSKIPKTMGWTARNGDLTEKNQLQPAAK